MLSFFEPTQQLVAALVIGSCTLFAAVVNAMAHVRIAREARKKSQPSPPQTGRVRRWVVLAAGCALALGWSATVTDDQAQAADGAGGPFAIGGVASLLGSRDAAGSGALTVALLHLRRPLTDGEAVGLLHAYDLRPYAIDLRLAGEPEAWLSVPVGIAPSESMPRARADAIRAAWQETCAFESVMASMSGGTTGVEEAAEPDTLALRLLRQRAATARRHAEQLADDEAVIHGLRVLASAASASRAAQDSAVARAEIIRYDPGWSAATRETAGEGCEIVRMREDGVVTAEARRMSAGG